MIFFIVSKIFNFIVSPLVWLLFFSISIIVVKDKRKKKIFSILLLFFLVVFSNSFIVNQVLRYWEIPMNNIYNDTNKYDMAIVLGGGILDYDMMNDRIIFRQNTDRIVQVVELYKMGKVKKILISGGNGSLDKDIVPEARLLKRYLYFSGVDSVDIMLEDKSNNTYQNALYCNEILKEKEYYGKSMLLITSAYHMRRAVKCFERQGIKVIPYSTDKYSPNDFVIDIRQVLIPSIRAMYLWNQLFHEWVGCMVYYIMGYI